MTKPIEPRRLLVGAIVVAALLLPLYLFVLRGDGSDAVAAARLLATPTDGSAPRVGLGEGDLAPDFEVSDPAGRRFRLSELRGRPVLLNFWATWCVSCVAELPLIRDLQAELGSETFAVVALNAGEPRARAEELIDWLEAPFLYGLDPGLIVTDAYGVYGLPLTVFIDAEGVIQAVYRGEVQRPLLDELTRAAVEARPPGELPTILRLVTTIERDRRLVVRAEGSSQLRFESKALRCDASYCADGAVAALADLPGLIDADHAADLASPTLVVRFDPDQLDHDDLVASLVAALEAQPDPLYDRPLEVVYVEG
jgi:cytochrome c biogenesis protein CcmG/thiol:disulfide interchange protein DsbE